MTKRLLLIPILFIAFMGKSFGQDYELKYGKVKKSDFNVNYEDSINASAVVIGDVGQTRFFYNNSKEQFQLSFERTTRIKILTKDGYSYANVKIPLFHDGLDEEKVVVLKGRTYNLVNGKVEDEKLRNDAVFTEESTDHWEWAKFTMPKVQVGSIIEYHYVVKSDFIFNLQDWTFQWDIPVIFSKYNAVIPQYFNYQQLMQGYITLADYHQDDVKERFRIEYKTDPDPSVVGNMGNKESYNAESDSKSYHFLATNVPPLKDEGYTSNINNYVSKINFELAYVKFPNQPVKNYMGTWQSLTKSLLDAGSLGGFLKEGKGYEEDIIEQIISNEDSQNDKIAKITSYVRNNFTWDGTVSKYASKRLKDVLEEKSGNSADINLSLISLLRTAGIEADPGILSTKNNGTVLKQFPLSSQFNYLVAVVGVAGGKIMLDATQHELPIQYLPARCLNGEAFVLSETNPGWLAIQAPSSDLKVTQHFHIQNSGDVSGDFEVSTSGYLASKSRTLNKEDNKKFLQWLGVDDDYQLDSLKSDKKTLSSFTEKGIVKYHASAVQGNTIMLKPVIFQRFEKSPFVQEERKYPVDFTYPLTITQLCTFDIPEGYEVSEIPKKGMLVLPDRSCSFVMNAVVLDNKINVLCKFDIKKAVFLPDEYKALRMFFQKVIEKYNEPILLTAKE